MTNYILSCLFSYLKKSPNEFLQNLIAFGKILKTLPKKDREPLLALFQEGMRERLSAAEQQCDALKISQAALKKSHRALQKKIKRLEQELATLKSSRSNQ